MDKQEIVDLIQSIYDRYDEKFQEANKQWDELRDKPVKTIPEQLVLDTARINTSYTLGAKSALAELMNEIVLEHKAPKKK